MYWVGAYPPAYRLAPGLLNANEGDFAVEFAPGAADVAALQALGLEVRSSGPARAVVHGAAGLLKAAAALDDVVWIETFDVPQLYNMMGDYGGQIQTLLEGRGYTVRAYGSSGYANVIANLDVHQVVVLHDVDSTTGFDDLLSACNTYGRGIVPGATRLGAKNIFVNAVEWCRSATPPDPATQMHVQSITMALVSSKTNTYATATPLIVDGNGTPVSGASVSGQWSGPPAIATPARPAPTAR